MQNFKPIDLYITISLLFFSLGICALLELKKLNRNFKIKKGKRSTKRANETR